MAFATDRCVVCQHSFRHKHEMDLRRLGCREHDSVVWRTEFDIRPVKFETGCTAARKTEIANDPVRKNRLEVLEATRPKGTFKQRKRAA